LVEHATENRSVGGSIPPPGTININYLCRNSASVDAIKKLYGQHLGQQMLKLAGALKIGSRRFTNPNFGIDLAARKTLLDYLDVSSIGLIRCLGGTPPLTAKTGVRVP
jgi:hypothetical protein